MNTFQRLCVQFVERAELLNLKGKDRETECFAFFVGAATALQNIDHPDTKHVLMCTSMIISVRGYIEVARVASEVKSERAAA